MCMDVHTDTRKKKGLPAQRTTNRCRKNNLLSLLTAAADGGGWGFECVCEREQERESQADVSPFRSSPPPLRCPKGGGEVMYGPSPDRTTQQNRWTKSKKERHRKRGRERELYISR